MSLKALILTGAAGIGYIVNPTPAAADLPLAMVHWVGEFEAGADLDHYCDWVLDKIGVPAEEQASRKPDTGPNRTCTMPDLGMIWLYLTQAEADAANGLIGQAPLNAAEVSRIVSLPTPVDGGGPWVAPGQRGRQLVPAGILRIGVPVDDPPASGGVSVAVIDTGVDARNTDLNVVGGFNCTQDYRGPEGWGIDPHGHGTHVAGTIGAEDDDDDVIGVDPGVAIDSEVTFGAEGSASEAMVLCALNRALEDDVDVISASLGGVHIATSCGGPSVYTNGWCVAARRAVVVVAAGNDSLDAIGFGPANVPGVVAVGAFIDYDGVGGGVGLGYPGCGFEHDDDFLAVFSNIGETVRVVAPGGCVLSTLPEAKIGWSSGTSMATPHVSGIFAAFLAEFPDCRGAEAIRVVLAYAERWAIDHPEDGYDGWRGVNPPPIIRYVDEEPLLVQADPEEPRPCAFESDRIGAS